MTSELLPTDASRESSEGATASGISNESATPGGSEIPRNFGSSSESGTVPRPDTLRGCGQVFESSLADLVRSGRKFLAVYVTAGLPDRHAFCEMLPALYEAGADVVEVGIPFSDPVMDGPVIQAASSRALGAGVTPGWVLEAVANAPIPAGSIPPAVMTYANVVFRTGPKAFAEALAKAGIGAGIVADLPLEESLPWEEAALESGVAPVLLAAPNASDRRLEEICRRSRGFVYGVSLLGVTGPRESLSDLARQIGTRLQRISERPVGLGLGISTGAQAKEAARFADGVIVGSAVVRRLTDASTKSAGVDSALAFVCELRRALDDGTS